MPETPRETSDLEHEVRIAAPPERVFGFFTDPARIVQWMGVEATLDPRPGGVCRIAFQASDEAVDDLTTLLGIERGSPVAERTGWVMLGRFVDVDPPHRITLTWGWEHEAFAMPPQSTSVEVSLTPEGDGTLLRLVHRRLPPDAMAFHGAGWAHYLPRLALAAAGERRSDPWQAPAA